jgi:hypothetical protein
MHYQYSGSDQNVIEKYEDLKIYIIFFLGVICWLIARC